ncbi:hypothetical protein GALMADRAFT_899739 [Galerina marginata CBS 339.88]|uniref:Uncharacterized protein n=1 Tax=Galerina marginata (strain CBS 339.88) TaxID=685588 RepID=A0A067SGD0_GALM3|nr:hypothetical protein GALMADRAFT_899739 [Galerina marginata CBS 339.88]
MPETTRAYRFVYPNLLVAGLERAYVFDVRSGRVVLCVDGIQVVEPQGQGQGGEEEQESAEQEDRGEEEGDDIEIFDEAQGASEPGAMWDEAEGSEDMDTDEDGDADTDTSPPTAAAAAASASAPTATTSTGVPQTIRQPAKIKRKGKERKKEKEKEKESQSQSQQRKAAELFAHTWDIQLGAPSVSSGVYLAFEGERVGVVTTNAVYVVTPSIPAEPPLLPRGSTRSLRKAKLKHLDHPAAATTSASHDDSDANHKFKQDSPSLQITRLPYFSNPSWLNEVSCLIMSDTGLYLNWNPTWPEPRGIIGLRTRTNVGDGGWAQRFRRVRGMRMRRRRR